MARVATFEAALVVTVVEALVVALSTEYLSINVQTVRYIIPCR